MKNQKKVKLKILYGKLFDSEWQDKTFSTEMDAVEWCRRNYEKIFCINDYRTSGQLLPHFEILDAINGVSR
jgi:hypothetical protein